VGGVVVHEGAGPVARQREAVAGGEDLVQLRQIDAVAEGGDAGHAVAHR